MVSVRILHSTPSLGEGQLDHLSNAYLKKYLQGCGYFVDYKEGSFLVCKMIYFRTGFFLSFKIHFPKTSDKNYVLKAIIQICFKTIITAKCQLLSARW